MSDDSLSWPDRFNRNVQIVEMYGEGYPLRDIGEEHGMSHPAILSVLDGAGITRRAKGTRSPQASTIAKRLKMLEARYQRARSKILGTTSDQPPKETP